MSAYGTKVQRHPILEYSTVRSLGEEVELQEFA